MKSKQTKILRIGTIILSLIPFLFSLINNCYFLGEKEESIGSFGFIAFLLGWMNLIGAGISWLANPFLFLSWSMLLVKKIKKALIFSTIAFIFSLSFMLFNDIIANEGGGHQIITSYDIGYYLWISSCGINFLSIVILYLKSKSLED